MTSELKKFVGWYVKTSIVRSYTLKIEFGQILRYELKMNCVDCRSVYNSIRPKELTNTYFDLNANYVLKANYE